LADENARRDCIHIAVAPVVAGEALWPGDRVKLGKDGRFYHENKESVEGVGIGVVDAFLTGPVRENNRFWLMLYPGTITGMRHVWTHPAFSPKVPAKEDVNP
jgi:hypothetical protein